MAYRNAEKIVRAVKKSGLPYTLVPGWNNRGRREMSDIRVITAHHTATPRSLRPTIDYPTMNVVKDGRPGLPGPLAQLGLGRSGRVYVIASGVANHAGVSRSSSWTNSHAIGIEAEGAMEKWPQRQYDAYVRLCRALADEFGVPVMGHKETASPPGRKNDPSFNMTQFRADIARAHLQPETPQPQQKGLFGMTISDTGINDTNRIIKPGESRRIPVGKLYSMATVHKGQTIRATVNIHYKGLHEEDVIEVAVKMIDYVPDGKPQDKLVGNFFPTMLKGKTGGALTRDTYVSQPYKVWQTARKGGSLRPQLQIRNLSGSPVTITRTEFVLETD